MARALIQRTRVKKFERRRRVVLVLTEGEADFLINQCTRVKGDPKNSPVKYAKRIRLALVRALGYDWTDTDARALSGGSIRFAPYDQLVERKLNALKAEAQQVFQAEAVPEESVPYHRRGRIRGIYY